MNISNSLRVDILNHSKKCYPYESCGFIAQEQNEYKLIKTKNMSKDLNLFEISPSDYLDIKNNYNIRYIYHNHITHENFSGLDKEMAKMLCLDLLLYILNLDRFKIFDYKSRKELWLE